MAFGTRIWQHCFDGGLRPGDERRICLSRGHAGDSHWVQQQHRVYSREFDIIRELAQGRKYEEIAADLGITPNTVKYHIKNILQKTGYQNTLQLVAEVVEKRLILPKY